MRILFSLVLLLLCSVANAVTVVNDLDRSKDIVVLFGPVDHSLAGEVSAAIVSKQKLAPAERPIYLLIDCPGGDFLAGIEILNAISNSSRPVYTVNMGTAMSMGGIILEYGKKRYAQEFAFLVIHDAQVRYEGSLGIELSRAAFMQRRADQILEYIAKRSGQISAKEIKDRSYNEWWLDSAEAVKYNFVDDIIRSNSFSLQSPSSIDDSGGNAPPVPEHIKDFMEKLKRSQPITATPAPAKPETMKGDK